MKMSNIRKKESQEKKNETPLALIKNNILTLSPPNQYRHKQTKCENRKDRNHNDKKSDRLGVEKAGFCLN